MDDANPSPLDRESESVEDPLFASFHKSNEYLATLSPFLAADLFVEPSPAQQSDEGKTLGRLTAILDEHQEQSYLLDPFLEQLVGPPVESLRAYAREAVRTGHQGSRVRVAALAKLIYWYTKTRGYKTIVRYFPHEPSDLTVVLGLISLPDSYAGLEWELCYVLLLWLSLISMLPFDLTLFDERGSGMPVAQQIESVARERLSKPGKERDAAAVLLARLYIRKDTCTLVGPFLEWAESEVNNDQNIGSAVLGILQVISELLKLSTLSMLSNHLPTVQRILSDINTSPAFSGNTLIRKQSAKIASRLSLLLLPPARSAIKSSWKALDTAEHVEQHAVDDLRTQQLEADVPEEVDSHIEDLVTFLQDKDTIVRWSAAKGLARISERLPPEFACQILDTIVGLFSIHDTTSDGQDYIPAAEGTWHGATLSCAEFARRRLVDKSRLPEVLSWASKGLQFDVRKGAVSVGSNVRDAAAYVLWALARSHEADVLRPWATSLAQRLVAVSLFDREIHIRRAASAAFQENVGRMGLFPHGIDVLQKTDFYAVSLRKHAFEVAAWQVAEHEEYRGSLISHLESITLKHWDPSMRSLAARALRRICELQLQTLGPAVASRQGKLLQGADATGVHGALLALGELAAAFRDHPSHEELEATRLQVFRQLADIPITRLRSYRGELLLGAACLVVAASVSKAALELGAHGPPWKDILDSGLKNRNSDVQNAAAEAWSSVSRLVDSSEQVQRFIADFPRGTSVVQQGIARALGLLDYGSCPTVIQAVIRCLCNAVTPAVSGFSAHVEARRECFIALQRIACQHGLLIPKASGCQQIRNVLACFQAGLEDYTVDQRGDVGSWIRIVCLQGIGAVLEHLVEYASEIENPEDWFPREEFQAAVGAVLKQGVERLDNVRQEAGSTLLSIIRHQPPSGTSADAAWHIDNSLLMTELFVGDNEGSWKEGGWLFPRAVRLLIIPQYRRFLLRGLVISIGSRNESTLRPAGSALTDFATTLPVQRSHADEYDLCQLSKDLLVSAKLVYSNNNLFIPYLQTFDLLMQADVLQKLAAADEGSSTLQDIVTLASKNTNRIKNIQRLMLSMRIVVAAIAVPIVAEQATKGLAAFLCHTMPKVRSSTAEALYMVSQTNEVFGDHSEDGDSLLLETAWLTDTEDTLRSPTTEVIKLLRSSNGLGR